MKLVVTKLDVTVIILACCLFISSLYIAPLRRTFIGQISRWVLGESRGKQIPNDLSDSYQPEYVNISSGLCGVCIGATNYALNFEVYYSRKLAAGIYTYFKYRK